MKKIAIVLSCILFSSTAFLMLAGNNNMNKNIAGNAEPSVSEKSHNTGGMDNTIKVAEAKAVKVEDVGSSPYDKVEMWQITFFSVTTLFEPISAAEAKRIEASGDDEYWVDYDESQKQWYLHGNPLVEAGTATVTDPKWVRQLNLLMQNPEYEDYSEQVKIRGKIAYANWYDGNRGGGVAEDFPPDIEEYLSSMTR